MTAKAGAKSAPNSENWVEIAPFTQARELETGESFIASYLGANEIEVDDPNAENPGDTRLTLLHEFQENGGDPFAIWGSAGLDKRLAEVAIGTLVKVQYEGIVDLKGGRTARSYRVWASA